VTVPGKFISISRGGRGDDVQAGMGGREWGGIAAIPQADESGDAVAFSCRLFVEEPMAGRGMGEGEMAPARLIGRVLRAGAIESVFVGAFPGGGWPWRGKALISSGSRGPKTVGQGEAGGPAEIRTAAARRVCFRRGRALQAGGEWRMRL